MANFGKVLFHTKKINYQRLKNFKCCIIMLEVLSFPQHSLSHLYTLNEALYK